MQFTLLCTLLALAAPLVAAAKADQRPVLVSYPAGTSESIIEEAKAAIVKAGGVITHEYNLIKGFAAEASSSILENIQALEAHAGVLIEEDQVVKID